MEVAEPETAQETLPLAESAESQAAEAAADTEMPAGMETIREAETDPEAGAPTAERSTGNDG
jgi:hypothetical protein